MSVYLLLLIANGAPVFARMLLRNRFAAPVDGGLRFIDGRPLFGPRKTVCGLLSAVVAATIAALVVGLPWFVGLLIACGAMIGDLFSSFIKRRFGVAAHKAVWGVDQIPESLIPLLLVQGMLDLNGATVAVIMLGFCVTELGLSYLIDRFDLLGMHAD